MKTIDTKDFGFELKTAVDETGVFTGIASAYGVTDLGMDLVEAGAFTKTIQEKPSIPMLWQHKSDMPIGLMELTDSPEGLLVKGTLNLDLQQARDAYSLIKKGIIKGLSIGYRAVKKQMEGGVRRLKEIELFEISIVTFPMLPLAQISSVKNADGIKDFTSELAEAHLWSAHGMMLDALDCSLCDARWMSDGTAADKIQQVSDSIEQFRNTYLAYLPSYFALTGVKSRPEEKTERIPSAAQQAQIKEAISKLQALLPTDAASTADETAAAVTPEPKAAAPNTEPGVLHSMVDSFRARMEGILAA